MGILGAGFEGETIWMVADRRITVAEDGEPTRPSSPIIETVRKPGLIGMLGDIGSTYDVILGMAQLPIANPFGATLPSSIIAGLPRDDLIPVSLYTATVSKPVFFMYATRVEGTPRLYCFHGGQVEETTETVILDTGSAMETVERYLHEPPANPPFEDFRLDGAEPTSQFYKLARAALFAGFEQNTATTRMEIAAYLLTPQGSRLCAYSYSTLESKEHAQPPTILDHLTRWLRQPKAKRGV